MLSTINPRSWYVQLERVTTSYMASVGPLIPVISANCVIRPSVCSETVVERYAHEVFSVMWFMGQLFSGRHGHGHGHGQRKLPRCCHV